MESFKKKDIVAYLRKYHATKSSYEIAEAMKCSRMTIMRYAKQLGISFKKNILLKIDFEPELKGKIKNMLLKGNKSFSVTQLSDKFDCGVSKINSIIETLKNEGFNISVDETGIAIQTTGIGKRPATQIDNEVGTWVKVGFVTDNHLGSNYERLDVLNALYDRFKQDGITTVYNAGNMIDGEARFNRFDIHKHGMESQVRYMAEVYPKVDGLKTYYITGDDHEGWYTQREGVEIGRFMERICNDYGRSDMVYLGHMEHDIELKAKNGSAFLRIVHPGMGSAYAISYTSQKLVETYSPGEKPAILLMGHYHKAEFLHYRGVYIVQGGCTMDQSPFMRKKRLSAHVGGWILEYKQGEDGTILSFRCEWIPYYDVEFYDKKWKYQTSYKS